jgi:hypothetical protein
VAVHYEFDAPSRSSRWTARGRECRSTAQTADELTAPFRRFDADDARAVADPHGRRRPVLRRRRRGDDHAIQLKVTSAFSIVRAPFSHCRRPTGAATSGQPARRKRPLVRTARIFPSQR